MIIIAQRVSSIVDADGAHVVTATSTLVVRGDA
jgi:hypothetical protein